MKKYFVLFAKNIFLQIISLFILVGVVFGAGTIISSLSQTVSEGDIITSTWYNLVNNMLSGPNTDGGICSYSNGKIMCNNLSASDGVDTWQEVDFNNTDNFDENCQYRGKLIGSDTYFATIAVGPDSIAWLPRNLTKNWKVYYGDKSKLLGFISDVNQEVKIYQKLYGTANWESSPSGEIFDGKKYQYLIEYADSSINNTWFINPTGVSGQEIYLSPITSDFDFRFTPKDNKKIAQHSASSSITREFVSLQKKCN